MSETMMELNVEALANHINYTNLEGYLFAVLAAVQEAPKRIKYMSDTQNLPIPDEVYASLDKAETNVMQALLAIGKLSHEAELEARRASGDGT